MSDYTYPQTSFTFGERDNLSPANSEKLVSGTQFDPEFEALVIAIASKLNSADPVMTGTITGGATLLGGTYA